MIKKTLLVFLLSGSGFMAMAQDLNEQAEKSLSITGGGTMGKKTILPKLNKLGIAQATILFNTADLIARRLAQAKK